MTSPVSVGEIITTCEKAYKTINAIKKAPSEFQSLSQEAITLNSALKSLADITKVDASILQRAGPQKEEELRLILEGCHQSLDNIREIMWKYSELKDRKKSNVLDRVKFVSEGKQELRDKLALHTASVNIFLTTLTHMSLARIEQGLDNYESDFDLAPSRASPRPPLGRVWDQIGWELFDSGVSETLLKAKYYDTVEQILLVMAQWHDGGARPFPFHDHLSASHHGTYKNNMDQERNRLRSRGHKRFHALQQNDIYRMRSWERQRPQYQPFDSRNRRREHRVSSTSDDVTPMQTSDTSQDEMIEVISVNARDSSFKMNQPKPPKRQHTAHEYHEGSMKTDFKQETLPDASQDDIKKGKDEKAHLGSQHINPGISLPPGPPSSPSSLLTEPVRMKRKNRSRKRGNGSIRHKSRRHAAQHTANLHEMRGGNQQDYDSDVEDLVDLFKEATAIDESLLVPGVDDLWDYVF